MEPPDWLDDITFNLGNPYLNLLKRIVKHNNNDIHEFLLSQNLNSKELTIVNNLFNNSKLDKLNLLIDSIKSGCTIKQITKYLTWNDFERLVAAIFNHAEWDVETNFRFFGEGSPSLERKRFEIDVMAWKYPFVLLIDCKRYTKPSQAIIRDAAEKQKNRCFELFEMIPIIHDTPELKWSHWNKAVILPMIITWRDHGLQYHDTVPIYSTSTLLDLLSNYAIYFHQNNWFTLKWEL